MITFTDEELKNLTKEIVEQPDAIQEWQDKTDASFIKEDEVSDLDNQNKKFQDAILNQIDSFQDELAVEAGTERVLYSETDLVQSAVNRGSSSPTPHFPIEPVSSIWPNLQPKKLDSNVGQPAVAINSVGNIAGGTEGLTYVVNGIKNGYNTGGNDSVSSSYIQSTAIQGAYQSGLATRFSNGEIFIMLSGSRATVCKVNGTPQTGNAAPNPTDTIVPFKVLSGDLPNSHTGTVTLRLNTPAFTEQQRVGNQIPPDNTSLVHMKITILQSAQTFKADIEDAIAAIDSNTSGAPYRADLDARRVELANALLKVDAFLNISGDAKYSNSGLQNITDGIATISGTNRVNQIEAALGSVTQQSDGSYSGDGLYFELFTWIDKRINISGGSLIQLQGFVPSRKYYTDQKTLAEKILSQYQAKYIVVPLAENYVSGLIISLTSVTDLSQGDTIKLMDNSSVVFDRVIDFVNTSENKITIDSALPQGLNALGKQARLFKEK